MKVMLVEDAPELRRRILKILAQMPDIEIAGQSGGVEESIRIFRETHPDLVLLDLRLSDGSGFDVLRAIKAGAAAPAVIMLTSFASERCRHQFMALGGDYFFDKSTQLSEAFALLDKLARRFVTSMPHKGETRQ